MNRKCFVKNCKNEVYGYSLMTNLDYCEEHKHLVDKQPKMRVRL